MKEKYGRGNSMLILENDGVEDAMSIYFAHPIWRTNSSDSVPEAPLDIQLELINACGLKCSACPIRFSARKIKQLPWSLLKRVVNEAAEMGIAYFTICGIGEAALSPHLFPLLRYIREQNTEIKGLRVLRKMLSILISNGMWSPEQITACIENPPDVLALSLAGLTEQEFIERRSGLNIKQFENAIKQISNERKVNGVTGSRVPIIHVSTHIFPNEFSRKQEINDFQAKWLSLCDTVVIKPTMHNLHRNESHHSRTSPCFETSRRLSIASNGDVWCGHHNPEFFGPPLGNIYNESLQDIWHGKKMDDFRTQVRAGIFDRPCCVACGGEIREWPKPEVKNDSS